MTQRTRTTRALLNLKCARIKAVGNCNQSGSRRARVCRDRKIYCRISKTVCRRIKGNKRICCRNSPTAAFRRADLEISSSARCWKMIVRSAKWSANKQLLKF